MKKFILILNGQMASGKSYLVDQLKKYVTVENVEYIDTNIVAGYLGVIASFLNCSENDVLVIQNVPIKTIPFPIQSAAWTPSPLKLNIS